MERVPLFMRALVPSLNKRNTLPVMACALQTFVLAREQILDPTFPSIEEYLRRNTQAYCDVLAQVGYSNTGGDCRSSWRRIRLSFASQW